MRTYGPAESPAIRRIFGIPSKVSRSADLTTSCSLSTGGRSSVMLGFLSALSSGLSSSDGIFAVIVREKGRIEFFDQTRYL